MACDRLADALTTFGEMTEGTDRLAMKVISVAALGIALHLLWRWRRARGGPTPAAQDVDHPAQAEPLLDALPTPPQEEGIDQQLEEPPAKEQPILDLNPPPPLLPLPPPPAAVPLFSDFTAVSPQSPGARRAEASPFAAAETASFGPFAAAAAAAAPAAPDADTAAAPPEASLAPWGLPRPPAAMERSATLQSAASDRRLPRVAEEWDAEGSGAFPGTSPDADARLALKLDVISGPQPSNRTGSYVTGNDTTELTIGRGPANDLVISDGEVSGRHAQISWSVTSRCWQIADLGSLNGTALNGEAIGGGGRGGAGPVYRLCTDDIIGLGTAVKLKVSVFPREMLPENSVDRSLSLSLGPGSLPRSLTMPKHRIPSFTSLLTPKINSPSKQAVVAAASDELRLECCIAAATGRDHARRGQPCEDVALAECPLHGSDLVLGPDAPVALFCVFDGHCGRGAAEAAAVALPDELSDRLRAPEGAQGLASGTGVASTLHESFLATDGRIASEEGCTATAVLAWRRPGDGTVLLQVANVGDSAALFVSDPECPVPPPGWRLLTEDHRLTNPAERERLARSGIPLHSESRRLYGLNLARALGDRFLKDEDLGLSAEPAVSDVVAVGLTEGALLVVASDGLWDVLDPEKVAAVVRAADAEHDGSVVGVAAAVVAAAKRAGTRDDVTALVVRLWPEDEWALRSPLMTLDDGRTVAFEA